MVSTTRRTEAKLHLLATKQVQHAGDGDHAHGGGLLLRVRGASCSWVLRYTAPSGRRREMSVGVCRRESMAPAGQSFQDARDDAHRAREHLRAGRDPLSERARAREAEKQAETVKKAAKAREHWTLCRAARDYHERAIEPTKTTKHAADWINSLENHIARSIWQKPIGDIEPSELLQALASITAHERARRVDQGERVAETVQRIRQRLDAIFEDAIFNKRCTSNPAAALRRKMRETLPKKKAGQLAALPYKEAPALMARLRNAAGTAARCLEFAVLTAARTGEAIGAAWPEFDLDAQTWLVPADRMKASGKSQAEPHLVHLSPRVLTTLRDQAGQHPVFVFPSTVKADAPQSNMAMLAVLGRLGVRDRTTVDGLCRATFSTWAYETAAARQDVIEACLAHREADKVKAAINRAQFNDERMALLAAWAQYLTQPAAAVLAISSRAA